MTPRRTLLIAGALVAGAALAVGLPLFQPWRLFTSTTVSEPLPAAASSPAGAPVTVPDGGPAIGAAGPAGGPVTEAEGAFVSHEHSTSGRARVIRLADGSRVLRLDGLNTSDGPALRVWLSDQPVREGRAGWRVFDDGAYVDLGELKGNRGDQNYPIPADADLAQLTSVSVWCERFSVSFGAAALVAVPASATS